MDPSNKSIPHLANLLYNHIRTELTEYNDLRTSMEICSVTERATLYIGYTLTDGHPVIRISPQPRETKDNDKFLDGECGSEAFKRLFECLAVLHLIKAGKKFVFELEGSKTGVRDFTISLCNELIESFIHARGVIYQVVVEYYLGLSNEQLFSDLNQKHLETVKATAKMLKEWIKQEWDIESCQKDGSVLMRVDKDEFVLVRVKEYEEDSEDDDTDEDLISKAEALDINEDE